MTVTELNENIIVDKIKDTYKSIKNSVSSSIKNIVDIIKTEARDNKKILEIIKTCIVEKREITPNELKLIKSQLKDNGRLAFITAVGVLPGSALTLPILLKIAKSLNIDLDTSKTFD